MSWNYFTQCGQNFPFSRIFYRVILYWEICANYSIFIFKLFYIFGGCAKICPAGAIDKNNPKKISDGCLMCCACVKACPQNAKYFDSEIYLKFKAFLEENYSARKEPELFYWRQNWGNLFWFLKRPTLSFIGAFFYREITKYFLGLNILLPSSGSHRMRENADF